MSRFGTVALILAIGIVNACGGRAVVEEFPAGPEAFKHVPDGVLVDYGILFPTSGTHSEISITPGFYTEPQPLPRLVHALEHGNIVIYYDTPGDEVMGKLQAWTQEFSEDSEGVIATPDPTLGRGIVLTAWEKRLVLDRFDDLAAIDFIDAYRGRTHRRAH